MKNILNRSFYKRFLYILPLLIPMGSIYGMKRLPEESSRPMYSIAPEKHHRFEKWQDIWIKTSDNQLMTMPEWQIDQIKVLQLLLINQKGTNSKNNPIDLSHLQKNDGTVVDTSANVLNLIKTALDLSKNPQELAVFLQTFFTAINKEKYKKDQEDYRTLINTASDLEANALSAALASAILVPEMQQKIGFSLVSPIATYFIDCLAYHYHSHSIHSPDMIPRNPQIKISPTGKVILINDPYIPHVIFKFDLNTKNIIGGIFADINYLEFSPAGTYIIDYRNNTYEVHDPFSKKTFFHISNCTCIAFSPNDNYCLYNNINAPGIINLMKPSLKILSSIGLKNGHAAQVNTIKFSPDGNYIISGSNDDFPNNLILWDGNTFEKITSFDYQGLWTTHTYPVVQADFTPDSKYIISRDNQNNVIVWDVASKKPLRKFDKQNNCLWQIDSTKPIIFQQPKSFIYNPKMLHHYINNFPNDKMLCEVSVNVFFKYLILPINENAITDLIVKPDSIQGVTSQFPYESSKFIFGIFNNNYNVINAVESSDSQYLIFSFKPNSITLRFSDTGKIFTMPVEPFNNIQLSPQNDYIIATHPAPNNCMFSLWNLADIRMIGDITNTPITLSQSRFLYRLYLAMKNNVKVVLDQNDPDYEVYLSLPPTIKDLVDRFLPFGLASEIAQKALREYRK